MLEIPLFGFLASNFLKPPPKLIKLILGREKKKQRMLGSFSGAEAS